MPRKKGWVSAQGKLGKVIAAKVEEGVDLIEGIFKIAKENRIKSGNVTAIGSLRSATVAWANSIDVTKPIGDTMTDYTMQGPVEMAIGWGVFGTANDGKRYIHFHALIMDKNGVVRCGNLKFGTAPVSATVDMTIQELKGLSLKPVYHEVRKNVRLIPTSLK